jgi:hypothetical protein
MNILGTNINPLVSLNPVTPMDYVGIFCGFALCAWVCEWLALKLTNGKTGMLGMLYKIGGFKDDTGKEYEEWKP